MAAYFRKVIIVAVLVLAGMGGGYYWKNLRGIGPAIKPAPEDITQLIPSSSEENLPTAGDTPAHDGSSASTDREANQTDTPLRLPAGFSISIIAKNLTTPRVLARDSLDNIWVSEMNAGAVTRIDIEAGKAIRQERVFKNLKRPHGLVFDPAHPSTLYIAEEDKISRVPASGEARLEKIIDLPVGGRHFSRTIGFGSDGRLYVSIGSSCDVCHEEDERRAAIYTLNPDRSDFKLFARGLRNTVFFARHPVSGELWGTDMGRDRLGDDLPPDEINIIREGGNYGWPICYGNNVHDTSFDTNTYIRNPCMAPFEVPSHIDLPAHSAPLGLAFIPESASWPQEYWNDVLVAFHGSWNRSVPTGYKVVRIKLDREGNYEGTEDFLTGWLQASGALGRPVDILATTDRIYISDDKAGVIYQVKYAQ